MSRRRRTAAPLAPPLSCTMDVDCHFCGERFDVTIPIQLDVRGGPSGDRDKVFCTECGKGQRVELVTYLVSGEPE